MIETINAIAALCMIAGGGGNYNSVVSVNNLQIACQQRMAKCIEIHLDDKQNLESRDWILLKCVSGSYKEKKK
jgi:hypothetical protein